jgi:RNA polymerase sigma factor (sigma-70 family)
MSDPAISAQTSTGEAVVTDRAAAFEDFFRGQTRDLYAHLCLITGNRAEAEELAQDAFLKVWERWDRVADMDKPVGYLYRTAMNLFRKRYRRVVIALRKAVSVELREDEFATAEDRSLVAAALAQLAPRQRAALVLTETHRVQFGRGWPNARSEPWDDPLARITRASGHEAPPGGQ